MIEFYFYCLFYGSVRKINLETWSLNCIMKKGAFFSFSPHLENNIETPLCMNHDISNDTTIYTM